MNRDLMKWYCVINVRDDFILQQNAVKQNSYFCLAPVQKEGCFLPRRGLPNRVRHRILKGRYYTGRKGPTYGKTEYSQTIYLWRRL